MRAHCIHDLNWEIKVGDVFSFANYNGYNELRLELVKIFSVCLV